MIHYHTNQGVTATRIRQANPKPWGRYTCRRCGIEYGTSTHNPYCQDCRDYHQGQTQ